MFRRAVAVVAIAATGACGGSGTGDAVRVAAASSLTDVIDRLDERVSVSADLNGSAILAEQVLDGLDVDVFLSADEETMARVAEAGLLVGPPTAFAENRLVVAVPVGNPGGVTGVTAVGDPGLAVGLCDPAVPCGALAHAELGAAGITPAPDTEEPNVRSLLAKLRVGELDVALIYATDAVTAADDVEVITDLRRTTPYLAGILRTGDTEAGQRLVDVLRSAEGVALLTELGFSTP